jgi:hypothetical protein
MSSKEIHFVLDILQLQSLQLIQGEEKNFNTDAKNSIEKLSLLLNIDIKFLD